MPNLGATLKRARYACVVGSPETSPVLLVESLSLNREWVFLGASVVKNLPASAGDVGLIPGLERSLEKEVATHSSILAWEIPWTEEPGGYSPDGGRQLDMT